jgi:hypothetical protein
LARAKAGHRACATEETGEKQNIRLRALEPIASARPQTDARNSYSFSGLGPGS